MKPSQIQTIWLDQSHQILLQQIPQIWTIDDFAEDACLIRKLLEGNHNPVAMITELPRAMKPPSLFSFHKTIHSALVMHEEMQIHTVVYVSRVPDTRILWREILDALRPNHQQYFFVSTREDALDIIYARSRY